MYVGVKEMCAWVQEPEEARGILPCVCMCMGKQFVYTYACV